MKSSIVTVLFSASLGFAGLLAVDRAHAEPQGGIGANRCGAPASQAGGGASLHGLVGQAGAGVSGASEEQQQALGAAIAAIAEGEARVLEAQRELMLAIADQAGRSGQVSLAELSQQVDAVASARQELAMVSRQALGQLHAALQQSQRAAFADAFQRIASASAPGGWFQGFAGDVGLDVGQQARLCQGVAGLGPDFDAAQAHGQAGIAAFRGAQFPGASMAPISQIAAEARESTARYVAVIADAMASMQKEQLARAMTVLRAPVGVMGGAGHACSMGMGAGTGASGAACPMRMGASGGACPMGMGAQGAEEEEGSSGTQGAYGGEDAEGAYGPQGAEGGPEAYGPQGSSAAQGAHGAEGLGAAGPGPGANRGPGAQGPGASASQHGPAAQGPQGSRGGAQRGGAMEEGCENVGSAQSPLIVGYGSGYGYGVPGYGYGWGVPYGGGYGAGYGYYAPYASGYGYATPFGYGQGSSSGYSSRQVSRSGYSSGFVGGAGYGGWGLFY